MDQATGLLEAASEREAMTIIVGGVLSGAFLFALSWKGLSVFRDMHMRDMDTIDKMHGEEEKEDA